MGLESQALDKICRQVYRQFPVLQGVVPKVQSAPSDNFLVVFQGKGKTADGHPIQTIVRVVATPAGKIIKITSSR